MGMYMRVVGLFFFINLEICMFSFFFMFFCLNYFNRRSVDYCLDKKNGLMILLRFVYLIIICMYNIMLELLVRGGSRYFGFGDLSFGGGWLVLLLFGGVVFEFIDVLLVFNVFVFFVYVFIFYI